MKSLILIVSVFLLTQSSSARSNSWTRDDFFLNPTGLPVDGVTSFAVADLDQDGQNDLVIVQNSVLKLFSRTIGQLPAFQELYPGYFGDINLSESSGIALYDFDGDGIANPITLESGKFIYWRSQGQSPDNPGWIADTTLLPAVVFNEPWYPDAPLKPSFADLDQDGDADLITGQSLWGDQKDLYYFENIGSRFEPVWRVDTSWVRQIKVGYYWWAPRLHDIDRHGHPEITLASTTEGSTSIYVLKYPELTQAFWLGIFDSILDMEFADVNGDHLPDLILLFHNTGWRIYLNNSNFSGINFDKNCLHWGSFRTSGSAIPFVFDMDQDGRSEFTIANWVGGFLSELSYAEQYKQISFENLTLWQDRNWLNQAIFALLNCQLSIANISSTHDDLMLVASGGFVVPQHHRIFVYRNTGSATLFNWRQDEQLFKYFTSDTSFKAPAFADLDGDRDSDLLVHHGNHYEFFENRFDTIEHWQQRPDWLEGIDLSGNRVSFGDIDRDGDSDLAIGTQSGQVLLFENIGSAHAPQWQRRADFDSIRFQSHACPALGDFDGDGDADLLIGFGEGGPTYHGPAFGKLAFYRNDFVVSAPDVQPKKNPDQFGLVSTYPNPFVVTADQRPLHIQLSLYQPGILRIGIFNVVGQLVYQLHQGFLSAGHYNFAWSGRDLTGQPLPGGIYFVRIVGDRSSLSGRLLLLR